MRLISLIEGKKLNITSAAKLMGINYENAKAIYRTYRLQGRQMKKKTYTTQSKLVAEKMEAMEQAYSTQTEKSANKSGQNLSMEVDKEGDQVDQVS